MQLLVIGCGYLGQRVADLCLHAGHTVHAVTRSAERGIEFRTRGWSPIVADICIPQTLQGLPAVDAILFAVGYDRTSGRSQQEVYVQGLDNVLHAVSDRCRTFVYISSSSVYGQQAGEWIDESSPCEPTQPGGQCCLQAERLLRESLAKTAAQPIVLRLSGIYGPGRLLSRIDALRRGEPLAGSPDSWLNLIHVDDAAVLCQRVLEAPPSEPVLLVSDDEPVPRGQYYRYLADLVGAPAPVFDVSQTARRGAGGLNKRCSNQRIKQVLAAELRFPTYRDGLRHAVVLP